MFKIKGRKIDDMTVLECLKIELNNKDYFEDSTYTISSSDGGTATDFTWSITINNIKANIVSQNGTSCILQGVTSGSIKLQATDGTNTIFKVILITNY